MTRLAPQPWMTSAAARRVMETLEKARPGSARFVGGCVRNALLNEPVSDIDIATQLAPEKVMMAAIAAGMAAHPTGIEHGTVTLVADHHPFEVTTLRRDVETDGRRAVVEFTEDWAEDAQRRDFRMNALYCSLEGEVFDPTGGGLDDIRDRRIIFVGDAKTRIREDYLRILRFFRFYAWYGHGLPDASGLAACNKLRNGLTGISAERIWMEMKKLLAAGKPIAALEAMDDAGVFDALFDEAKGLDLLRKVVGLETREHFTPDPMIRFLALFWKDASAVRDVSDRLKLSNDERNRLNGAAKDETPLWSALPEEEVRRILYRIGPQVFQDRVLLEWAQDESASDEWRTLFGAATHYERPVMPVSGNDLLARGISEGPAVGEALRKQEAAWIDSDFRLSADELLKLL
ncbi:MAG TPA: CCA tRNA nucleotidyltransferase [Hyphomonadaceae bacterium]|jgi:poly(A) polymerase|nr:CCA tRNA nucleotidyltransferase [Hyphomonadaceae bacterium]